MYIQTCSTNNCDNDNHTTNNTTNCSSQDKKFKEELEKGCATKTGEWEERSKLRAEELVALADTVKILNDDDALEFGRGG